MTGSIKLAQLAILSFVLGMIMTGLACWQTSRHNLESARLHLDTLASSTAASVVEAIKLYKYGLNGARGVITTHGEKDISRTLFHNYAISRDFDSEFPGARGFGFIRRVSTDQESEFLAAARADGWPEFKIRELEPNHGERFVIQYIEPVDRNILAVGLDIASEKNRREAATNAMNTGEVNITGPITLVQATGAPLQSFLILNPIYRSSTTPATEEDRKRLLFGWSYAPLLMQEVLSKIGLDASDFALSIQDVTDTAETFFQSEPHVTDATNISSSLERDVFGRRWRFNLQAEPGFVQNLHQTSPAFVFGLGSLFSLLLSAMLAMFMTGAERRRQLGEQNALLAAVVEGSHDSIIGQTPDGIVTSWNQGAELLFGYTASGAIGQPLVDLIVPQHLHHEDKEVLQKVHQGQSVRNFITQRQDSANNLLDVSVTASPIRDANGKMIGASKSIRDISELLIAERKIRGMNQLLENQVEQRTAELAQSNQLLAGVLNAASEVAIIASDHTGKIKLFNRGAERLLGYSSNDVIGSGNVAALLSEADHALISTLPSTNASEKAAFMTRLYELGEGGTNRNRECYLVRQDGSSFPATLMLMRLQDGAETYSGYLVIALDISVQHDARTRLEQSLTTTKAILNTAANPILTLDTDGKILSANPAAESVLGYLSSELVGRSLYELMAPHQQYQLPVNLSAAAHRDATSSEKPHELRFVRKDGSDIPIQLSIGNMILSGEHQFVCIMTDLSIQEHQRSELSAARDQLLMASNVAGLGVWTWVIDTNELLWNGRMFHLYGYELSLRESGLSYQHWRQRVHPDDVEDAESRLNAALAGTGIYNPVFRIIRPDGDIRYVRAAAHVEHTSDGDAYRITGINIDITDQQNLEQHLKQAKFQADAASAAKSHFLANMSHEIRTPMNAVLGLLQLLEKSNLDSRQQDYVEKAGNAGKALLDLLNDILDYSKIEAGKLELEEKSFDIDELLRGLASILSAYQGQKPVEILFDIASDIPDRLIGDSLRLQQVLINLSGNAFKFTERGQVVIGIEVIQRQSFKVLMRVSVTDTGIGISEEHQKRIFEGFTQAETSTARRFGGTGLGLVISQRLVNLMGGEIELESQPGKGSRFCFDIEMGIDSSSTIQDSCAALPENLRVLIVDDNAVAREVLLSVATALGWHAHTADDGASAKARVARAIESGAPYQLILLDWKLPDTTGDKVAHDIMTQFQLEPKPKILMTTAYGREAAQAIDLRSRGAIAGVVNKPTTPRQLSEIVANALQGETLTTRNTMDTPQRLPGLRVLVVEDNALNRQVISELLEREGVTVTLANNGKDGVKCISSQPDAFDIVIMDMQMPEMDGLEATRIIRADERFKTIPILAMTANASAQDKQACINAGMNDHIGKPVDINHVVDRLKALTATSLPASTPAQPTTPPGGSDDTLLEPADVILRRLGGNKSILARIIEQFSPEQSKLIGKLMEQNQSGNPIAIADILHSIKGSASTAGAIALARTAAQLEQSFKHHKSEKLTNAEFEEIGNLVSRSSDALLSLSEERSLRALSKRSTYDSTATTHPSFTEAAYKLIHLLQSDNIAAIDAAGALPRPPWVSDEEFEDFLIHTQSLEFDESERILNTWLSQQGKRAK